MEYFVIGPDGNRYGPADVPTLKQWVTENRLTPTMMLEDVMTSQRIPATSISGLFDHPPTAVQDPSHYPPGTQFGQPTNLNPYASYPRQQTGDNGQTWIALSWVFSAFGLCCPVFCPLGIAFAFIGGAQGSPNSLAPKIFGFVVLGLRIAMFFLGFFGSFVTGFYQ